MKILIPGQPEALSIEKQYLPAAPEEIDRLCGTQGVITSKHGIAGAVLDPDTGLTAEHSLLQMWEIETGGRQMVCAKIVRIGEDETHAAVPLETDTKTGRVHATLAAGDRLGFQVYSPKPETLLYSTPLDALCTDGSDVVRLSGAYEHMLVFSLRAGEQP